MLIGVACVDVTGKLWTIFCSTVSLHMLYGVKFFCCLGFSGRCKDCSLSTLCLEELVGETIFKHLDMVPARLM